MSVLIIAEAGVNHDGDLAKAKAMVEVAAAAGADYVKFQSFSADELVIAGAPKAEYQLGSTDRGESQLEMLRRLELSDQDHRVLKQWCDTHRIGFLSTPFDVAHVDLLLDLGMDRIKVPSGEIVNLPLLRRVGSAGVPVIMSTGMATIEEIGAAISAMEAEGLDRSALTLLHCNTEYPTPMADVNLKAMDDLAQTFGVAVGYSDHSEGIEVAIAAVARGATVIEKHFTLDPHAAGPDHSASLAVDDLGRMVSAIRNIEAALGGHGKKTPSASEAKNVAIARRTLVAARPIAKGEPYGADNVAAKRAGVLGVSPMAWDAVMGRAAPRDFLTDEPIEL